MQEGRRKGRGGKERQRAHTCWLPKVVKRGQDQAPPGPPLPAPAPVPSAIRSSSGFQIKLKGRCQELPPSFPLLSRRGLQGSSDNSGPLSSS